MNICRKPPNKTAPEKSDEAVLEVYPQQARRNGWSWPPHPFQFLAWLLYFFFALVGFGILVPLLPVHWVPAGYICPGIFFLCHLIVHLTAVSVDPADDSVRQKNYKGPLAAFSRSQHSHVIENRHCHICDVDVSSRSKHCGTCNKCVCGFDHHCMWLNNCVGQRNYWLFLNSVISAILGLLLILLVAFYVFVEFFLNPMRLRTDQHFEDLKNQTDVWFVFLPAAPIETQGPAIIALAGVLIVLGLLTLFLLGHLLIFHIYLMCHRITTYEYIVQQRPSQEMKDPDKQLESFSPQVKPIQEIEFYTRNFGYTNPEIQLEDSSGLASGKDLSTFCIHSDGTESKTVLFPEQFEAQTRDQPKKDRLKMSTVPWSAPLPDLQPESSLSAATSSASSSPSLCLSVPPVLPKAATPPGSNGPVQAAGPPADYHSESAESMEEIPVAQTRLGSSAPNAAPKGSSRHLPLPAAHFRGEGQMHPNAGPSTESKNCQVPPGKQMEELQLSPQIPAVFVSRSSGEPPVLSPLSEDMSSELSHRKHSSKRHKAGHKDSHMWESSASSTAA